MSGVRYQKSKINKNKQINKSIYKLINFKFHIFFLLAAGFWLLVFLYGPVVNKPSAIYKLFKFVEIGWLIWYIKTNINIKKHIIWLNLSLSSAITWQSILAIAQWLKQGSIFGYWFFGEQPFTSATLAVKKISLFGQIKVLPMGTFPHPNVLAGFLTVYLALLLYLRNDRYRVIVNFSFVIGLIALLLTFSLPAWTIMLALTSIYFWQFSRIKQIGFIRKIKFKLSAAGLKRQYILFTPVFLLLVLLLVSIGQFIDSSSIQRRLKLAQIAINMWQSAPFFGVGLNNFVVRMEEFGRIETNYRFLQPVHNVFLLMMAETGMMGLIVLIWLIIFIWKKLRKNLFLLFALNSLLMITLLDHYFITIQQGLLMGGILIGILIGIKNNEI